MQRKSPDRVVVVFLKSPDAGKVKTRLAKSTGHSIATHLYIQLTSRTLRKISGSSFEVKIYVTPDSSISLLKKLYPNVNHIQKQRGRNLGDRMAHAPHLGEHSREILCDIGHSGQEIDALAANGAIGLFEKADAAA